MQRNERPAPVSGWGWVLQGLVGRGIKVTDHQRNWDGLFRGPCPCGREVNWDAFHLRPICVCPVLFPEEETA